MPVRVARMVLAVTCLVSLAGCETTSTRMPDFKLPDIFSKKKSDDLASADPSTTGSISHADGQYAASPNAGPSAPMSSLVGGDPKSDVKVGKQQYRAGNYGDAEKYFRRAVETNPRDSEAWLGLAASYDKLKRFDLADRAYDQAIKLAGPRPEILNNQGYSMILRGDFKRAEQKLYAAQARDPGNPYIQNNLAMLAEAKRTGKVPD